MRIAVAALVTFVSLVAMTGGGEIARSAGAPGTITTIAGGGVGDGGPATNAALSGDASAIDSAGNIYVAGHCRVRRIDAVTGIVTTVAGTGECGYTGDGGAATSALFSSVLAVAVDATGILYVAESEACRVRRVASGIVDTFAGTGTCGYNGEGLPTTAAQIQKPYALAVGVSGELYIGEFVGCRVREVSAGTVATVAGTGVCGFNGDGVATASQLNSPVGLDVAASGEIYIADQANCRIRLVVAGGLSTVAGTGACTSSPDGAPAVTIPLRTPGDVFVEPNGDVLITEALGRKIRRLSNGSISTVAGTGANMFSGDGGPPLAASFLLPGSVLANTEGDVFIGDGCRIREIHEGIINTIAGTGQCFFGGDGADATNASLHSPEGLVVDEATGDVFVGDNCRVRKISSGIITTVVGSGSCVHGGDGGPALAAGLETPVALAFSDGDLYVAELSACRVRKVSGGIITSIGDGSCHYNGENIAAEAAGFRPTGLAVGPLGELYISDVGNCRIRKVMNGLIVTVAGNGILGCNSDGDGGPALDAGVDPFGLVVNSSGEIYFADRSGCRIRRVSGGVITTVAGTGECGFGGDVGPALDARFLFPRDIAIDAHGDLYVADTDNCRIRRVSNGFIGTVAGDGICTFAGDGGQAIFASLVKSPNIAVWNDDVVVSGGGFSVVPNQPSYSRVRLIENPVLDAEADGVLDGADNCPLVTNFDQADGDSDSLGDACEASFGTIQNIADTDGDGCEDGREVRLTTFPVRQGGYRDPLSQWDVFDVPAPALNVAHPASPRNRAIGLQDVAAVLAYVGTADDGAANSGGYDYDTDHNANSMDDGRDYDRTPAADSSKPWRSGPPNGAVTLQDVGIALAQVGLSCIANTVGP